MIEIVHSADDTPHENRYAVDIASESDLQDLRSIGSVDAVIHTAGIAHRMSNVSNEDYYRVNVTGSKNIALLASSLSAKQVVLLSSVLVYGRHHDSIVTEDTSCSPADGYGMSKLEAEIETTKICERNGIGLTILRSSPVIGEGCKGNLVRLVRAIDKGYFINIGSGENRKSMVYVGDLAAACITILKSKTQRSIEIFNLAAPPISVREICNVISEGFGKPPVQLRIPAEFPFGVIRWLNRIVAVPTFISLEKTIKTWISEDVYSTAAIKKAIRFDPIVNVPDGIRKTVNHYIRSKNNRFR